LREAIVRDSVGIFGLGLIGMTLARRLISAGYTVIGTDPRTEQLDTLNALGGTGGSPDEVWQADVIFSAVFDTGQLEDLIANAPVGARRAIASFSTCDPGQMAGIAAKAMAKGWHFLETPISGTSRQLSAGEAVFFVAGDKDQASRLDVILKALGKAHYYVGALGNGNRTKLAINLVLGLNRAALAEGIVFAQSMGLDAASFLELAQKSAAQSQVMAGKGPLMVAHDFEAQGRISQSAKDFRLIQDTAQATGQHLPFVETYGAMMDDCLSNAEGDLDNSAIILAIARSRSDS